jgi:hypothetical protein
MKIVCFSETLAFTYESTRCQNPGQQRSVMSKRRSRLSYNQLPCIVLRLDKEEHNNKASNALGFIKRYYEEQMRWNM